MNRNTDKLSTSQTCPECTGRLIDNGEDIVCSKCGAVTSQSMVDVANDYDKKSDGTGGRVGPATNGKMIDTEINSTGKDYTGRKIRGDYKTLSKKIGIIDKRQKIDSTKLTGTYEINRICDKMSLTSLVRQNATNFFIECKNRKLLTGRKTREFAAACVYVSYRKEGYPKNFNEFQEITNTTRSVLISYSNVIKRELEIVLKIMSPEQYLPMIIYGIMPPPSLKVQKKAQNILAKYLEKQGKNPKILAAGALYFASVLSNESISEKEIAIAAKISEVSVRKRYQDMKKKIKF